MKIIARKMDDKENSASVVCVKDKRLPKAGTYIQLGPLKYNVYKILKYSVKNGVVWVKTQNLNSGLVSNDMVDMSWSYGVYYRSGKTEHPRSADKKVFSFMKEREKQQNFKVKKGQKAKVLKKLIYSEYMNGLIPEDDYVKLGFDKLDKEYGYRKRIAYKKNAIVSTSESGTVGSVDWWPSELPGVPSGMQKDWLKFEANDNVKIVIAKKIDDVTGFKNKKAVSVLQILMGIPGMTDAKARALLMYHGGLTALNKVDTVKGLLRFKALKGMFSESMADTVIKYLFNRREKHKPVKRSYDSKR